MRFGRRYENRKEQRELSAAERRESRWNILEKTAVVIFFGMLFLGVYIWQEQHMPEELSAKVLRFHVLANSDSEADQELKLDGRAGGGVYMNRLHADEATQEESVKIAQEHLEDIQEVAGEVIARERYDYPVTAAVEWTEFPDKTYGDYHMPAGSYEALRVVIGEGKGRNWWCVMFPNMCFSDTVFEVVEDEAKENLYQVMTLHEYRKMIESPDKEVRFRYLPF